MGADRGLNGHPFLQGNGNLVCTINSDGSQIKMSYDKENRLSVHQDGSSIATYLYDGDGMKRMKFVGGARTTLIWDGTDYLQGRS